LASSTADPPRWNRVEVITLQICREKRQWEEAPGP
jgi:hypothetical protein